MATSADSTLSSPLLDHYPTSACGLLGSSDSWMATDFIALEELIGAPRETSTWLSGIQLDRIVPTPQPFETVCETASDLRIQFIIDVTKKASQLSAEDTLVLVLVGHGLHDGQLIVGESEGCILRKSDLEMAVSGTQATIWLISTACYSGAWSSGAWTLLGAAEAHQEFCPLVMTSLAHSSLFPSPKPSYGDLLVALPVPSTLSIDDEKELHDLAQDLLNHNFNQTARETGIILNCHRIVKDPLSIDRARRCSLLSDLRSRKRSLDLAVALALNLDWSEKVEEFGGPDSKKQRYIGMKLVLEAEAEASGCLVNLLTAKTKTIGIRPYVRAAAWLARVWEATGRRNISNIEWASALEKALIQVDNSSL